MRTIYTFYDAKDKLTVISSEKVQKIIKAYVKIPQYTAGFSENQL